MSPPTSPPAKYLPGKIYTPRKTTSTSPQSQLPSTSTSPPPIPACSSASVSAPAHTFCPIVETPAPPPKLAPPAPADDIPTWCSKLAAAVAAPPPITTTTSYLIPTLPQPEKRVDEKAWADEDYPELIDDTLDAEYDYHYQAQQIEQDAPRRYFSFSNTLQLQSIPEESDASISAFEAAPAERMPEKCSAPLPSSISKWTSKDDGGNKEITEGSKETKEGTAPVTKDHGSVKKENLPFRGNKPSKDDDDEKRFI